MSDPFDSKYYRKYYHMTVTEGVNSLTVSKSDSSVWSEIKMEVNGQQSRIFIRSKEMAEALHFMLSQMLGGE